MLIDELIERAFSDGYEYALEEQREFAYPGGMVGTGIQSARLVKKPLAPSASVKTADMMAKFRNQWSRSTKESSLRAANEAKTGFKKMDPMPAKASLSPKVRRPAPDLGKAQSRRTGNPFSSASQFLSGPGGLR